MKPTVASRPRTSPPHDRLAQIEHARRAVIQNESLNSQLSTGPWIEPWIERSWRRCLASGHRPDQHVNFEQLSAQSMRHSAEANQALVQVARPVLERLGQALASTRYFAILTNAEGVVVDVNGPIDRQDRRANLITRIGVDLSENAVGTTAISAALTELHPVWLHRGEHFFADTSVYSCAGAPLFGPQGHCVGMLDLTGIEAPERPELRHLVTQSARSIENALTLHEPHALLLRLNWPGRTLGEDADGLIGLDPDGFVITANSAARQMVPQLPSHAERAARRVHCSDLFALPYQMLFDAALSSAPAPLEVPMWSGLRLTALPLSGRRKNRTAGALKLALAANTNARPPRASLKEVEIDLIRQAVTEARGNVMQAARVLGISRATVYRKLGRQSS
ncbi:MAG: histidine kinase [Gammaproteobacteria bacterium]|jgi:transcriptional regulator of acetoin/glycerol metabolism|nr:histidine kinase [Gammaproteobacteria bacterium]MBU0788426.1 histidine kinase [Gammaproteobacteria bacterium]MBU0816404.1 histidine kinase [Gammaproteobacteria bacterium]MBU1788041.1 histidine kinase [Gammaproteobacteria bacterium]